MSAARVEDDKLNIEEKLELQLVKASPLSTVHGTTTGASDGPTHSNSESDAEDDPNDMTFKDYSINNMDDLRQIDEHFGNRPEELEEDVGVKHSDRQDPQPKVEEVSARESTDSDLSIEEMHAVDSPPICRLHKRRHLIVEVVLPTLAQLKRRRNSRTEDFKKMEKMNNPKVKKKQNMDFSFDTVRDRLKAIGLDLYPIALDKALQEVTVSRNFMAATYGGSMQATCPNISPRLLAIHGMDNFVYLHPDYQPIAPRVSGAPGLFFSTEAGGDWPGVQRVFTRIDSNIWQYMGMYEIKTCPSLTKEEWVFQEPKVRSTWARQICIQGWGTLVCARVFGRKKFRREPTKAEIDDIFETKRYQETTPDDVMEAYMTGEERLGVWTMKCVGYDDAFQLQLCEKFPTWVPPPRKSRKGKKENSRARAPQNTGTPIPHNARTRKRKRSETPEPDLDLMVPESEDSDHDYRPRGKGHEIIEISDDEQ